MRRGGGDFLAAVPHLEGIRAVQLDADSRRLGIDPHERDAILYLAGSPFQPHDRAPILSLAGAHSHRPEAALADADLAVADVVQRDVSRGHTSLFPPDDD